MKKRAKKPLVNTAGSRRILDKYERAAKAAGLFQYHRAANRFRAGEFYVRGRSRYTTPKDGGILGAKDMYEYNRRTGRVARVFYNITCKRFMSACRALKDYRAGKIPKWVWENYINNGYLTRNGLYLDYTKKEKIIKAANRQRKDIL